LLALDLGRAQRDHGQPARAGRRHQGLGDDRPGAGNWPLVLNGTSCNLAKGQTCDWIVGTPEKVDGVWQVMLILPHGARAPEETLFPAPIGMAKDGPVPLPPYDAPETDGDAPEPGPEGDPQPPA
jgi:hypothetical protein